jgi:hypothetical protein
MEPYMHVPLLFYAKGKMGSAAGTISDMSAGHQDVAATLADLIGVPSSGFYQNGIGRSLLRKEDTPKHVYNSFDGTIYCHL